MWQRFQRFLPPGKGDWEMSHPNNRVAAFRDHHLRFFLGGEKADTDGALFTALSFSCTEERLQWRNRCRIHLVPTFLMGTSVASMASNGSRAERPVVSFFGVGLDVSAGGAVAGGVGVSVAGGGSVAPVEETSRSESAAVASEGFSLGDSSGGEKSGSSWMTMTPCKLSASPSTATSPLGTMLHSETFP